MNGKLKSNHNKYKQKANGSIYSQIHKFKKKSEKEKENYMEVISNNLRLPSDILSGAPIVTATGKNQVCIENYKGIIEYNEELIKVQTKICRICIEGSNLNIDYFTNDEMRISGIIHGIHYK